MGTNLKKDNLIKLSQRATPMVGLQHMAPPGGTPLVEASPLLYLCAGGVWKGVRRGVRYIYIC